MAARRARLRRLGARGGLATLLLASVALGAGFWQQQREAARQRRDERRAAAARSDDSSIPVGDASPLDFSPKDFPSL